MLYTVDPNADEPIMLINKHIGYDPQEGMGIDGSSFQSELLALDTMGKKRIQVWINSPGGSVLDGMSIYNAILKSKTKVDTYCAGIAASIAGVIFQAGRNRIMSDYGLLMYHNPYNSDGSTDEGLDKIKDSLATMISQRCGKDEAEVLNMMNKTSWINAQEAMDSGLCDMVETTSEYNKKRMVQSADIASDMKAFWKERNVVLNSLFNNKRMNKVTNKLNLNPDASEDSIVKAIEETQNKVQALEAQNKAGEDKILELEIAAEEKRKELEAKASEYDALKAELDEIKNKTEEAEKARVTEKATEMVMNFVKAGRIKNEATAIEKWVNLAKNDLDGTKSMIEELPLNRQAAKIGGNDEPVKAYNAAAIMAEKAQK